MPRINSLKIRKLGNVAPGTELKFGPKGAVLLGRNGTGKTTLLNLLTDLCRCDLDSISGSDYEVEFSQTCIGDIELHVTASCDRIETKQSVEAAADPIAGAMRTILQERARHETLRIEAIHAPSGTRTIVESNDRETRCTLPDGSQLTEPIAASQGWTTLVPAWKSEKDLMPPLFAAFIELVVLRNTLRRFDEGLDYFRNLTERGSNSAYIECLNVRQDYFSNPTKTRLISGSSAQILLDDFKEHEKKGDEQAFAFGHSSKVKYLETFCKLADFEQSYIWADLDEKRSFEGGDIVNFSPLRFTIRRNGLLLHHRHLSFGQCRLLAFLHYLDSNPSLVMADELVNGMHHEWISQCLHLMRDSQAFLSSQNPLLFDFLTFESPEDVASRFVICDLDEQHRFVWRNMDEADAREFYETHKAGLQHASEILRTRGYW